MKILMVFRNIKYMLKNHTSLFLFIFVVLTVCTISALFSVGTIDAAQPRSMQPERGIWDDEYGFNFGDESYYYVSGAIMKAENDEELLYKIYDVKTGKELYSGTDYDKAYEIFEPYEKKRMEAAEKSKEFEETMYAESIVIPSNIDTMPRVWQIKEKIAKIAEVAGKHLKYVRVLGYVDNSMTFTFNVPLYNFPEPMMADLTVDSPCFGGRLPADVKRGDTVKLGNTTYKINSVKRNNEYTDIENYIGGTDENIDAKYEDLDDSFIANYCSFALLEDTPQEIKGKVDSLADSLFSDYGAVITRPTPVPLMEKQHNNMSFLISLIVILVIMFSVARLYSYIISLREKSVAVSRICGAKKYQIFYITLIEISILLCLTFFVGLALFHFWVVRDLGEYFPTFSDFFTPEIYITVFAMYYLMGTIILSVNIFPFISGTVSDSIRRVE